LVSSAAWQPLTANVIGWLVAFNVSYSGHYFLTFRALQSGLKSSLPRFFVLSGMGFLVNETAYAILLRETSMPYEWLLGMILIGVAVLTFIFSRFWAFAARH